MISIVEFFDAHIFGIFIVHLIISFFLALVLSKIALKRYVENSDEVIKKDKNRLDEIAQEGIVFKTLFKVSLHKNNQKAIFIFILFLIITIPFLGYLFAIWIVWYLLNVKYDKKVATTSAINLDEFESSFLEVERTFGEGSMIDIINSEYAPKSKKLQALSSLAANTTPANLKIIKQTLSSRDDEIRMFGYAIINKAEKELNKNINKNIEIITTQNKKEKPDKAKIAYAAKELAFLYWEMVYTELSHESLKQNFLNFSVEYIDMAKEYFVSEVERLDSTPKGVKFTRDMREIYKICSNLYMLRGKIYMKTKVYEKAQVEFTIAQELLPEQSTFILPYLAEVYYVTNKYNIVKTLLSRADGLELNSTLYPIIQQWKAS
jgi:hypothetical protein